MKRLALIPLLASAAFTLHAETFFDNARVRSVQPQYENVTVPRNECTNQWVTEQQPAVSSRNYGGLAVGGVAGALLGNQVGGGRGREAATALGAVLGAFTGDRVANRDRGDRGDRYENVPREVTTCQTVNDVQSRLTGYQVAYEYRGQQFTALMPQNPGSNLQVRVSVDPVVR